MSDRQPRATSQSEQGLRVVGVVLVVALVVLLGARNGRRPPAVTAPTAVPGPPRELSFMPVSAEAEPPEVQQAMPELPSAAPAPPPAQASSPAPAAAAAPPEVRTSVPPASASAQGLAPPPAPKVVERKPRSVPRSAVAAWSKPGLCTSVTEAASARQSLTSRFRLIELGERGTLYLDPRLPEDVELPVLGYLNQAENELRTRLGLQPPRPLTFIYSDQQLMKASACINEDVVAFYDGALHIVAGRPDALASVLHEYTHHALFSAGLMAPTWAHEGIAMNIAKEQWWRDPRLLPALVNNPFSLDDMDRVIAYKLKSEQAVAFYVQSAALVECLLRERQWSLRELFLALSAGIGANSVSYDIPELERRSFLSDCVAQGLPVRQ